MYICVCICIYYIKQVVSIKLNIIRLHVVKGYRLGKINYPMLRMLLSQIDWYMKFRLATNINELVNIFNRHLKACLQSDTCIRDKRKHEACDFPCSIVKSIHKKTCSMA